MGLTRGDSSSIDDRIGGAEVERYFDTAYSSLVHFRSGFEKGHPLMFRVIPSFDGAQPEPGFEEVGGVVKPTSWFIKAPCVAYAGSAEKLSFIAYDPYAEAAHRYDRSENPYVIARNRLWKASGDKDAEFKNIPCSSWRILLQGRDAIMPDCRMRYFWQGVVYMVSAGSRVLAIDDVPVPFGLHNKQSHLPIISTSSTGGQALLALGMKLFQEGIDITALDFKDVLVLANDNEHDRGVYDAAMKKAGTLDEDEDRLQNPNSDNAMDASSDSFASYTAWNIHSVHIPKAKKKQGEKQEKEKYIPIPKYRMPPLDRYREEILARKVDLWNIFAPPSHEQLCEWMARMYADKPVLLEFGWKDRPEFFTEAVRGILARRKQVAMSNRGAVGDTPSDMGRGSVFNEDDDEGGADLLNDDDPLLDEEDLDLLADDEDEPVSPGKKVASSAKKAMRRMSE